MTAVAPPRATFEEAPATSAEAPAGRSPGWLLETSLVALGAGVAAVGFGSLFADAVTSLLFAGAAAIPVVIAALLARNGRPLPVSIAVSVAASAVYAIVGVLVDTLRGGLVPSAETVEALGRGLVDGWSETLDAILPIGDAVEPRLFIVAVCWLAGTITGELAARTRYVAQPMLPVLALAVLVLPLRQPLGAPDDAAVVLTMLAVLLVPLARATPERVLGERRTTHRRLAAFHTHGTTGRRLGAGLPIVVVAAVAAVVVAEAVPLGRDDPFDPRSTRDRVVDETDVINPLIELKSVVLQEPAVAAMDLSFDRGDAAVVEQIPMVRLDTYDGALWTSSSRYERIGGALTGDGATSEAATTVTAEIEIQETSGPWLPVPGVPERIDAEADILHDPATGNVLPLVRGSVDRYRVRSMVTAPTAEELQRAEAADGPDDTRFLALPAPPPEALTTVVAEATAGVEGVHARLAAVEAWLEENVTYDLDAASGHSYGRLVDLVSGSRRGFSEQLAAAFTVMARSMGVPARVVVGYRLVEADAEGTATPLEEITSAQLHAWSEVHFEGLGWVTFDPTPLGAGDAPTDPQPPEQGPGTTLAEGQIVAQRPDAGPEEAGPTEGTTEEPSEGFAAILRLVVVVILAAVLLVALALAAVRGAKRRRRRRRKDAVDAPDRLLGAWEEALDRLTEAGVAVRASMTLGEVADSAGEMLSRACLLPVLAMIPDVRRTLFAAEGPNEAMAEQAWARLEELETGLRVEVGRWRHLQHRYDPRSLRRA